MTALALSDSERATDLLARMTLTEKTQQLVGIMPTLFLGPEGPSRVAMARRIGNGIGHISNFSAAVSSPAEIAQLVNSVQRFLKEETRLGIPALFHAEGINGFVAPGYTSFPTPIGLAATWDPAGVQEMANIVRGQMRSVGVSLALSPVMDVARDARWGRVHETYGEDVYLVSSFSVAFTRGLQGRDLRNGVAATGKHFLGYAVTEGGQNMAATHLGTRELYDVYATPFEAAIALANLDSVMNSYSEVDGIPVGANRELLRDLLRGRMGLTGPVVSDYSTVEWLRTRQGIAESDAEAGAIALAAGIDVELPSAIGFGPTLEAEVRAGRVRESDVDDAVTRVLAQKFRLGLFDVSYVDTDPITIATVARDGRDLSAQLARESITMLKNRGILPLSGPNRIAVIGPNAESAIANFAAYTYPLMLDMFRGLATGESRMAGVEDMAATSDGIEPEVAAATAAKFGELFQTDIDQLVRMDHGARDLASAVRHAFPAAEVRSAQCVGIRADDPMDLLAADDLTEWAEVVILALGGRSGWFGTAITEGEGTDAARVELPGPQVELVHRLSKLGKPLVGVLYQGRPHAIAEIDDLLAACLVAYYPGPAGADAVASVLAGETNPSGKLPYTIPRATGQLPIYYSQKRGTGYRRGPSDQFREYIDLENSPLYAFGHGLSYSEFDYGELSALDGEVPTEGGVIRVSVNVRNCSSRAGTEVVQFYASVAAVGVTRPASQLVGYARVRLEPDLSATVGCDIPVDVLGYSGVDGRFQLQPGAVVISVGGASDSLQGQCRVLLGGNTADLEGRRSYLSRMTVRLNERPEAPA